jgi:hypothetical protein
MNNKTISRSMLAGSNPSLNFDSIQTVTVGTAQSTLSFTSIPATYTHLQIRGFTLGSVTAQDVKLQFNSDTATNYSIHYLQGSGSAASSAGLASQSYIEIGLTGTTANPSVFVTDILDYGNTNKKKTVRSLSGYDSNGSGYVNLFSGYWNSTTAISTITLTAYSGNFNTYSSFALYGIKG